MKGSLTLIALLATMLVVAACGGRDTTQSQPSAPNEPRQGQAEPAPQSAPEETAREGATRNGGAANGEAAQEEDDESHGLSVTTLEGERVSLGGQGDVTALYFMAGW